MKELDRLHVLRRIAERRLTRRRAAVALQLSDENREADAMPREGR